jgi:hypothetical protein
MVVACSIRKGRNKEGRARLGNSSDYTFYTRQQGFDKTGDLQRICHFRLPNREDEEQRQTVDKNAVPCRRAAKIQWSRVQR